MTKFLILFSERFLRRKSIISCWLVLFLIITRIDYKLEIYEINNMFNEINNMFELVVNTIILMYFCRFLLLYNFIFFWLVILICIQFLMNCHKSFQKFFLICTSYLKFIKSKFMFSSTHLVLCLKKLVFDEKIRSSLVLWFGSTFLFDFIWFRIWFSFVYPSLPNSNTVENVIDN